MEIDDDGGQGKEDSAPNATESTREAKGVFTAEVVGISQKTMRFRNPVDFQYRPDINDPVVQLRQAMERLDAKSILSYRMPDDEEDFTLTPEEQERRGVASSSNLRIIPAPVFTRYDIPMNYNFKQNQSLVQQTVVDKETGETSTRLVHASKLQDGSSVAIKWGEPTPLEIGPERERFRDLVRPELLRKLETLFEQRPAWTRLGLLNQLDDEDVRTIQNNKPIWSLCSYVFHDGPWRDSVLKLGYDPRQDPEAYKYANPPCFKYDSGT
ncbi:tau 95 subunit of transcription factor TFIIIC [Serendipita sp. 399]|nr:tau 95 subunit of transcription factor TFIIIC [Serendipita sp. 399]